MKLLWKRRFILWGHDQQQRKSAGHSYSSRSMQESGIKSGHRTPTMVSQRPLRSGVPRVQKHQRPRRQLCAEHVLRRVWGQAVSTL